MNRDEALRVLQPLASNFRELDDDDTTEQWLYMIGERGNFSIGMDATREVIENHHFPTITFAVWYDAYKRLNQRNVVDLADRRRLGTGLHACTLIEYLDGDLVPRLQRGARCGRHGDTLEDWRRVAERQQEHAVAEAFKSGAMAAQLRSLPAWFDRYDKENP